MSESDKEYVLHKSRVDKATRAASRRQLSAASQSPSVAARARAPESQASFDVTTARFQSDVIVLSQKIAASLAELVETSKRQVEQNAQILQALGGSSAQPAPVFSLDGTLPGPQLPIVEAVASPSREVVASPQGKPKRKRAAPKTVPKVSKKVTRAATKDSVLQQRLRDVADARQCQVNGENVPAQEYFGVADVGAEVARAFVDSVKVVFEHSSRDCAAMSLWFQRMIGFSPAWEEVFLEVLPAEYVNDIYATNDQRLAAEKDVV